MRARAVQEASLRASLGGQEGKGRSEPSMKAVLITTLSITSTNTALTAIKRFLQLMKIFVVETFYYQPLPQPLLGELLK